MPPGFGGGAEWTAGDKSSDVMETSEVLGLRMETSVWNWLHQLSDKHILLTRGAIIGKTVFISLVFLLILGSRFGSLMDLVVQAVYWEAGWDIVHHQQKSDIMGKMESKFLVQVWMTLHSFSVWFLADKENVQS